MKARVVTLVALAAAVTLTSVAAAGPAAAKQRVAINMKIHPQKTFCTHAGAVRAAEARLGLTRYRPRSPRA